MPRKLYPRKEPRRRNRHSDRAVDRELDMERRYSTVASKAVEILPNEVNAGVGKTLMRLHKSMGPVLKLARYVCVFKIQ